MKIYPLLPVLVISAFAQTPAPKPSAPASLAAPSPQHATPGQLAPGGKGPFSDLDPDRVVATIGEEKMTAAQFDSIIDGLPQQYQAQVRGPAKRQFMEQLIMIKVMAHQASVMHLDQLPATKQQIEFAKENILANMAGKNMVESAKVDDAALHKYYDDHKSDFQQVSAHHILIRFKGSPVPLKDGQKDLTEEEALAKAQEIEKKLKAGGDFAELAKAESADAGSAAQGGDLGAPFKHGQMVKPFEDAAFSLPPNQISDPVKTQFGYHIIRVDKVDFKSYDEAKAEMEAKLKPEMARKQMDDLKASMGVKLDDNYFGPPAPPPGTTPNPGPQVTSHPVQTK
ncbi:MAG TPA: peptidylprolyl isomerase [Bryobacteraceae bacterium]